jgi:ribonucleoside-diphosphate reductase beta chain
MNLYFYFIDLIKMASTNSFIKNTGSDRYTVFPIKHQNLWDFYQKHLSTFWTVAEVPLQDDLNDWNNKLNDNERFFVKNVLAFFAASDGIVNENLVLNFYNEVQIPEARQFYTIQMMMESIHSEQYALLIDTYISNPEEKHKLFNAIETIPAVKRKAEWALKNIEEGTTTIESIPKEALEAIKKAQALGVENLEFFTKTRPSFAQRLLAFVCVEGIFFSGSFCAIYWLKSKGLLPGLATANNFITKDENLHAEFAVELYNMLDERLSDDIVHDIFKEAVEIEIEFITESLPVSLLGMNSALMTQHVQSVADYWLTLLGHPKLYNVSGPFGFMEMLSLHTHSNFFETKVDQYTRAGVGFSEEDNKVAFDDDDF